MIYLKQKIEGDNFITQHALADWRTDIKNARVHKMTDFIFEKTQILQSNAIIRNTPGALSCGNSATTYLGQQLTPYRAEIAKCVSSATDENAANKCCDLVDSKLINHVSTIFNNTNRCINNS
ncbi:uncharacterized protein LOC100115888 isoform X2 [Nasonia vitripennis]|uniref:Uncharacterized protein n=1 Tax=Nasonia vitripennis TaxID=7425 RepID=A0A7M7TBV2_NASVI|nr:uncharacterized protein LOC100115888 isoform X2 [Nasonia vitripennis]XP_032452119.1 uncharacterized protein LOC100115888 isoform X2 [Nasonia vitripennis]XP_032452120.1 uncharacterized protein LOC100115888 isoform X2 [Nasonia vitripennis]